MSIIEKSNHREKQLQEKIANQEITPEDVLQLNKITDNYLCSPDANIYDIDFTRFRIRDLESQNVLFEIAKPQCLQNSSEKQNTTANEEDPGSGKWHNTSKA